VKPAEQYAARLAVHEARVTDLTRREARIAGARLLVALWVIAIVIANLTVHVPALWWVLPPLLAFVWLVGSHTTARRERARAARAAAFYRRGIDRLNDRWMGAGQTGERFLDAHHVYAADLDLFGRGSLFELLSAARTRMGEQMLAQWLLAPASREEIHERQASIADLRERLTLREDLDAAGDIGVGVLPDALLGWSESANQLQAPWIRPVTLLLPVLAILTALLWGLAGVRWPFLAVLLAEVAVFLVLRNRLQGIADSAESSFDNLSLLSALLTRVEREPFSAPALLALQHQLTSHAQPASHVMAGLRTITDLSGHRKNLLVRAFFELPLLYSVHIALAAESWRSRHGTKVRDWLATTGRLEALSSLAMYAYEHPDDPFPTLAAGAATFEARGLGHPLLAALACVRNDVAIREPVRTLLVSGSNMSGKSTLLRAVGVNIVLAMAGAPVRAATLALTPLQVGASIRVNDSLNEGQSRFYAEITRLRQLYEIAAGGSALLFLLDELLQGTNSKDRRIGAEGVLREFIERGAIGLISTHDLALTDIAGNHADALRNVHFEDFFDNGRISFDFKLRDGMVTKSNGIELMRSIGLKV
jgi:MutS domain V/MutS domain III